MRAVRCHALLGPSGLRVEDLPEPTPGRGEVQIDVRAAGVNYPDVLLTHAWVAEEKLRPHVDAVLPFARAQEGLERLERREVKGKVVLVP